MRNKLKVGQLELSTRFIDVANRSGLSISRIWNLENSLAHRVEDETKQKLAKYLEPRIEKILGKVQMAKRFWTVCNLAEFLGCLTHLLYKLTRLRKIPYVKWRGRLQFYVSLRDRFIEENIKQPVDWVKKIRG